MILCIGSGKGGTGKTTVSLGFALALAKAGERVQYLDCDVEEPNAHLFFKGIQLKSRAARVLVPKIDRSKCDYCGECSKFCAYHAIAVFPENILTFNEMCHNCGGCVRVCPKNAISEVPRTIGNVKSGTARGVELVFGELNIGEAKAPPLIREVKKEINGDSTIIIDAPPGTACPFVEAVRESYYCALVTEPTPFGLHDLKIAVEVVRLLGIPFGVVINRSDVGDMCVENFCSENKIDVLMKIKNNRDVAVAYSNGLPITDAVPESGREFLKVLKEMDERTGNNQR